MLRHKTRFHRFPNNSIGTDKSRPERKSSLSTSEPENSRRDSLDRNSNTGRCSIGSSCISRCSSHTNIENRTRLFSICTLVPTKTNYETTNSICPISANFKRNLICALTCASDPRTIEQYIEIG